MRATRIPRGFYLEAEKDYERYLQIEPQGEFRKEARDRLSEIAVTIKGDHDRAVVLLEAMYLELGEDSNQAWKIMFQLGEVYAELGNRPKAIESFEKCLIHAEGNPEHVYRTQLRMARLYRDMGSYDLVASTLENCADSAFEPEAKARCLYELAQSYSFISGWVQARKALEELLEIQGLSEETHALAVFLLADIYEHERDYGQDQRIAGVHFDHIPKPKGGGIAAGKSARGSARAYSTGSAALHIERNMTTFFCMRHGMTDRDSENRVQGATDTPVNEKGRKQAADWARSLSDGGFDLIVTGSLAGTRETAGIINEVLNLPVA